MSQTGNRPEFICAGRRPLAFTPLFLVVIVLETTDLVFAVDSIPAVFGVTRDPFHRLQLQRLRDSWPARVLFSAGRNPAIFPVILTKALPSSLMFIGAKMLAEPWVHISTGLSLAIVGGVIAVAVLISARRGEAESLIRGTARRKPASRRRPPPPIANDHIDVWRIRSAAGAAFRRPRSLFSETETRREFSAGYESRKDEEFRSLLVQEHSSGPHGNDLSFAKLDGRHRRLARHL